VPGDQRFVDWDEGMRLYNRTLEDRTYQYQDRIGARNPEPARV